MATVEPSDRKGVWRARAHLGRDAAGRQLRPRTTITAPTRGKAQRLADAWEDRLRQEGRTDYRPRTVADAVTAWLQACELKGLEGRTLHSYRKLGEDIVRELGQRRVEKLTLADVQDFYADLISGEARTIRSSGGRSRKPDDLSTEEGVREARRREVRREQASRRYARQKATQGSTPAATVYKVRHHHRALVAVLDEAIRQGWLNRNVAKLARRPPDRPKRAVPPTIEEVERLLKVANERSPVTERLIVVAIQTGMRRGELAAMRRSRFDVDQWTYTVDTAVWAVKASEGVHLKAPKTHASRVIPLSDQTVAAILGQAAWLEDRARVVRVELADDPFLWSPAPDCGVPPHPDWLTREFAAVRRAAGVSARFHDLRHAMATLMLDLGVPLPTVSERLGHANTHTTASIYAHGVSVRGREAAELLGRAFAAAGELES